MPSDSAVVLEAQGLCRREAGRDILVDLHLSVRRGDIVALLGLNGAGKSTTLRLLAGVLMPDAGRISITGHPLDDEPLAARRQIGFLPDCPPLFPDQRVEAFLRFCARLRGVAKPRVDAAVSAVLERCDLGAVRRRRIAQLSKGYRQRVGLAQALVHEPALILLDEPNNGLDPQQMQQMREEIRALGDHHAVIFSTHLLAEAQAVCNRAVVIHEGRSIADRRIGSADAELATLFGSLLTAPDSSA